VIDGHVVGVEDIEGTDGLLARVAHLRAEGRIPSQGRARRAGESAEKHAGFALDLPTIGPRTIEGAARPACRGGDRRRQTIVVEPQAMIEAADARAFRDRCARVMPAASTAYVARNIFLIATEESGDRLGASLMKVLRQRLAAPSGLRASAASRWRREGLASLFPIEELSIMGLAAVVKQLPMILRRIRQTADAVTQASPDILVIIDSPDFTHRWQGASAPATPRSRLWIMFRRRSGRGGRPRPRDAQLCRSCPRLAAFRTRGVIARFAVRHAAMSASPD